MIGPTPSLRTQMSKDFVCVCLGVTKNQFKYIPLLESGDVNLVKVDTLVSVSSQSAVCYHPEEMRPE